MNFHWPSFLLGYGAGVASTLLAERFRPFLTELATSGVELFDAAVARIAMAREDLDDVWAEARARTRGRPQRAKHRPAAAPKRKKRARSRTAAASRGNGHAPVGA